MKSKFTKCTFALMAAVVAFVMTGCGTLFYKERIGKPTSNEIDPSVLVLDCCGLLFGIIPGVVALVLDFNNNTIYYTKSEWKSRTTTDASKLDQSKMVALHVENMSKESIEKALSGQMGRQISLNNLQVIATK